MKLFEMMNSDEYSLGTIEIESDYNYQGIFITNFFNKLFKLGVDSKKINKYKEAFDIANKNMKLVRTLIQTLDTLNEQHKLGSIGDETLKNVATTNLNKFSNIGLYYECSFEDAISHLLDKQYGSDCMIRRKEWDESKYITYDFSEHSFYITYDKFEPYAPIDIYDSKYVSEEDINANDWEIV